MVWAAVMLIFFKKKTFFLYIEYGGVSIIKATVHVYADNKIIPKELML